MNPQAILGLLVEGARSNFWGLACPSYCTQPSWGLLLCCLCCWLVGCPGSFAVFVVCVGSLDLLLGLIWILPGPLQPSLFRGLSCLRLICMSIPPSNHDVGVKLRITLPGDLQVSVSGPSSSAARAAELLGYISLFEPGAGTAGSDRSF